MLVVSQNRACEWTGCDTFPQQITETMITWYQDRAASNAGCLSFATVLCSVRPDAEGSCSFDYFDYQSWRNAWSSWTIVLLPAMAAAVSASDVSAFSCDAFSENCFSSFGTMRNSLNGCQSLWFSVHWKPRRRRHSIDFRVCGRGWRMMLLFHHCARRDVIIAVWGCKQEGCHPSESFCSFSVRSFACGNGDNVFVSILKEKKKLDCHRMHCI